MTALVSLDQLDTHGYWNRVRSALVEVCELTNEEADDGIRRLRAELSNYTERAQLLMYHASAVHIAEDIAVAHHRATGHELTEEDFAVLRKQLSTWHVKNIEKLRPLKALPQKVRRGVERGGVTR